MSANFKNLSKLRRSPRHSKDIKAMVQTVEGVSLLDSTPDIDVLDMGLFTNDLDLWFAKAIFQYYLAMAIQKEHLGHSVVNPKTLLEQVEATFWKEPSGTVDANGDNYYPGFELLKRVKAARATKDDKALDVFLNQLSNRIREHCRKLRNEHVAELDAGTPQSPGHIHRATTPCSTTSSNPSSEDSQEVAGALIDTEIPSQGSGIQNTAIPTRGGLPLLQPLEAERPTHRYTSKLYEYAAGSGKSPEYSKEWVSSDVWRCEAVIDGIRGVGEARSWKDARHIASQKICENLGITVK
jgi:hypothetical protein